MLQKQIHTTRGKVTRRENCTVIHLNITSVYLTFRHCAWLDTRRYRTGYILDNILIYGRNRKLFLFHCTCSQTFNLLGVNFVYFHMYIRYVYLLRHVPVLLLRHISNLIQFAQISFYLASFYILVGMEVVFCVE